MILPDTHDVIKYNRDNPALGIELFERGAAPFSVQTLSFLPGNADDAAVPGMKIFHKRLGLFGETIQILRALKLVPSARIEMYTKL